MTVGRLIRGRSDVISIEPGMPLGDAAKVLVEKRIGAVLVKDGDRIAGILSERDIVRCMAECGAEALTRTAGDQMTRDLETSAPSETVHDAMGHMTRRRIRHLPVLDGEKLVGIVSIGDLVKARIEEAEREAESLKDYIQHG
ncbi:MAG: CBS domain-containing protein [Pacificimonas sp.]|jgi:CBS domain-containing protein|nr:CBS domain-containing protein [Pacificimonas sp.]